LNLIIELHDVEKASRIMKIPVSTVYRWINYWNDDGKDGLRNDRGKGGGKPPKLTKNDIKELERILRQEKEWWTTKEVRILIKDKFGIKYSDDQIVRILKNFGMNHAKPFPHDYRKPDNAEELLDNQLRIVFELLKKKKIPIDKIAIGFMDESSPQTKANTVRVWSFGKPKITKNTSKIKANTAGYYAILGNSIERILENSKKESIKNFLIEIKNANKDYKAIVVLIDNFSSHKSTIVKDIAKKEGIYLVYIPKYSPDLNPIEYIWKSIKRVISLTFVKTEDELKDLIEKNFKEFSKSLSFAAGWIRIFLFGTEFYHMLCG
jgi:transposase